MSTSIRPEVSKKNKYYISKHRYYELKHYCMQYQSWKDSLDMINHYPKQALSKVIFQSDNADPVFRLAEARSFYEDRLKGLEDIANKIDPVIGPCVLEGVISGLSYEVLRTRIDIPCCKDVYYEIYRKFFWVLDKIRN